MIPSNESEAAPFGIGDYVTTISALPETVKGRVQALSWVERTMQLHGLPGQFNPRFFVKDPEAQTDGLTIIEHKGMPAAPIVLDPRVRLVRPNDTDIPSVEPFKIGDWAMTREGIQPPIMGRVATLVWGRTFDGTVTYEGPGGMMTLEEEEGGYDPALFDFVHPDNAAAAAKMCADFKRRAAEGKLARYEPAPDENGPGSIIRKPFSEEESQKRLRSHLQLGAEALRQRRHLAAMTEIPVPTEDAAKRHEREVREADVVEAARRSQAEIRRHVDSYLKEHLEPIVKEVFATVLASLTERVEAGIKAMVEAGHIYRDRMRVELLREVRKEAEGIMKPFLDAMAGK